MKPTLGPSSGSGARPYLDTQGPSLAGKQCSHWVPLSLRCPGEDGSSGEPMVRACWPGSISIHPSIHNQGRGHVSSRPITSLSTVLGPVYPVRGSLSGATSGALDSGSGACVDVGGPFPGMFLMAHGEQACTVLTPPSMVQGRPLHMPWEQGRSAV